MRCQRRLWSPARHALDGAGALFLGVRLSQHPLPRPQLLTPSRYYGSIIPSALNVFSMQGFLILNCIIGGQTLASVSGHLDDTLGIVIIGVISLAVSTRAICSLEFTPVKLAVTAR